MGCRNRGYLYPLKAKFAAARSDRIINGRDMICAWDAFEGEIGFVKGTSLLLRLTSFSQARNHPIEGADAFLSP